MSNSGRRRKMQSHASKSLKEKNNISWEGEDKMCKIGTSVCSKHQCWSTKIYLQSCYFLEVSSGPHDTQVYKAIRLLSWVWKDFEKKKKYAWSFAFVILLFAAGISKAHCLLCNLFLWEHLYPEVCRTHPWIPGSWWIPMYCNSCLEKLLTLQKKSAKVSCTIWVVVPGLKIYWHKYKSCTL